MEKFVLTKEQYDALWSAIEEIKSLNRNREKRPAKFFCNNEEFIIMMGVSKRHALRWRNQRLIGFAQVGKHIFYTLEDIRDFIYKHYTPPLNGSGSST